MLTSSKSDLASLVGIDWNAPDGLPASLIFLLLTPADDATMQIRILGAIAKALKCDKVRKTLMDADSPDEYLSVLKSAMTETPCGTTGCRLDVHG